MGIEGCSGLSIYDYLTTKDEKEHDKHCKDQSKNLCSLAEGCRYSNGECRLNVGRTLSNAYINGGFGFGKLCLSKEFTRLILLILFPPSYVFIHEYETGFKNKRAILLSFIYTCLFYFPGLIYTLLYKHRR